MHNMNKLFLKDLPLFGKKILLRVDFNVPLDANKNVTDTTRIEAALPTIRTILENGGTPIIMSHLGRPKGTFKAEFSLAPVAKVLSALLSKPVKLAPDVVGEETRKLVSSLKQGEILLLENLRFYTAEEHPEKDPSFAKKIASYGDLYVNDAFGTAHRKHSSTYTLAKLFHGKSAAGLLLEKEIYYLSKLLQNPHLPFYALIGGSKISTKIGVLKSLQQKVERILIGGGMSYTFLLAKNIPIGNSIHEPSFLSAAKKLLEGSTPIDLPVDFVVAQTVSRDAPCKIVSIEEGIPKGFEGVDIGPKTVEIYSKRIAESKTLLWNGPVGVFEVKPFAKGTEALAKAVATSDTTSIVGGGDSIAAINQAGLADQISHLSTGGGATLEYIEHGTLPAIEALI
ncbi:MAG: Bifunctional PGK/TIM [Chlamydiales bacterium]|nr:Bifunctional PGK/TIM [Chlamydiales bacterium]MCH9619719.1 Bifunctional PGK/TIM [Chlamydiales bacterium]MCH9623325.1 Bifunctional PGK/TIM [Chlamydiales bacterium]